MIQPGKLLFFACMSAVMLGCAIPAGSQQLTPEAETVPPSREDSIRLVSIRFAAGEGISPSLDIRARVPGPSLLSVELSGDGTKPAVEVLVPGELPWASSRLTATGAQQAPGDRLEIWAGYTAGGTVEIRVPLPFEALDNPVRTIRLLHRRFRLEPVETKGGMGRGEGQFFMPRGGFVDSSQNIFVADYGNDRVQVFDKYWKFTGLFGEFGWSTEEETRFAGGQFNGPLSVCAERYVYVVDSENYRICRYDREGNFIDSFGEEGSEEGQFLEMGGIAKDFDNNVYVADLGNDRIQKFDSAGNFRMEIGFFGWGNGQLNAPSDIEVSETGDIIVLDSGNGRVQVFNKYGSFICALGAKGKRSGELTEPRGLDIVPGVGVLVADTGNDRLQLLSFRGGSLAVIGSRGQELGQFKEPWDVALGPESKQCVVVETGNHRLQVIDLVETCDSVEGPILADILAGR